MKIFNSINIPKNYKVSALAIGNFDGMHKGHQKVFRETRKFAKRKKTKFGVLTFTPLPIMFFYKNVKNFRLASEDQKIELFKKHQVDFVINIKFNKKFSKISAKDFIKKIIYKKMNPQSLSVSNNFKFGRKRKGNVNLLKKLSYKYDYQLLNISAFKYSGKIVSSTKIRKCLENASGCKVIDETKDGGYITPVESTDDFITYISRIRDDQTQKNSINMWIVSDNLLKGAALNAIQIANVLIKKYIN